MRIKSTAENQSISGHLFSYRKVLIIKKELLKKGKPAGNKRYNKCGYSCSLKHLKSLPTFVLADS